MSNRKYFCDLSAKMYVMCMFIYNQQEILIMKITIKTILSLPVNGASCHLLILNGDIRILLDCGISHNFSFREYESVAEELKTVSLVLISHSSLQYSGAVCFLIEEIGLNPKIFYTTQPIMRYSPLNIHEELLILRHPTYNKKVFNKMYKYYESIQLVKPHQKKCVDLTSLGGGNEKEKQKNEMQAQESFMNLNETQKAVYFTCYSAGGSLGSIAWRISYGIINAVYLVQYNNYSLYHINGLDLQSILQPTDILITDTYQEINGDKLKKQHLYDKVKSIITQFNQKCNYDVSKNKGSSVLPQTQKKLLLTCYPSQMLIELMAVLKNIIQENSAINRQKVKVVHLSSRFLQLIKSQIDCFSESFKDTLEKIDDYFIQTKVLGSRINIATIHSLNGILNQCINEDVTIYHLGPHIDAKSMKALHKQGVDNICKMKIMHIQEKIPSSAMIEEKEEMVNEDEEEKRQDKQVSQFPDETEGIQKSKSQFLQLQQDQEFINPQMIHGKYFSQIGFPHFITQYPEEEHDFDEYGIRHHFERFDNKKTIEDYRREEAVLGELGLQKKNSTVDIQIMNIQFKLPQTDIKPFQTFKIQFLKKVLQRTNLASSLQLISALKPRNIIFINASNRQLQVYRTELRKNQENKLMGLFDTSRRTIHLQLQNQLVSYKMNYIPIPTQQKLQRVKGKITYKNGFLQIHLNCLQEKEILDFRMQRFYNIVKVSGQYEYSFTGNGIVIDGIRLYRQENKVILEGSYSQEYFKVRKLLYQFLKIA